MKFYWNCTGHERPEKKQPLYCIGLYHNDISEGLMVLSTNEEEKLDDEVVLTFLNKYDNVVGKYETSDHRFYGDLDILTYVNGELDDKTEGIFIEFLKDLKR